MGLHIFGSGLNRRLEEVCLLIVVPKWKCIVLPKWKYSILSHSVSAFKYVLFDNHYSMNNSKPAHAVPNMSSEKAAPGNVTV